MKELNLSEKAASFRKMFKTYQEKHNLKQEELGNMLELKNKSHISQVLNGIQEPSEASILRLETLIKEDERSCDNHKQQNETSLVDFRNDYVKMFEILHHQLMVKDEQITYCLKQIDRLIEERMQKEKGR